MTRRSLVLPLLFLAAACGGGSPTAPATSSNNPTGSSSNNNNSAAQSAAVSLISTTTSDGYGYSSSTNSFSPASVTIVKGGTVTFSNDSGVLHNITFTPTAGAPQNVSDFSSGQNTRTFNTTGTFAYHCTNHTGMNGTVEVK